MLTISNTLQSLAIRLAESSSAANQSLVGALDALRVSMERRRVLRRLRDLRERDPRLFEETGVDPIDLPPPATDTTSLFPQSIIAEYLFGTR
jgi:hypothetical protein